MKEFTVVPVFIKFSMTFIVSTMWNLYCARIVQLSFNFREKKIDGIELLTVGCGPGCSSLWLWPGPDLVWSYRWGVGGPWGPGARSRDQARAGAGAGVVWPRPWRWREAGRRGTEDTRTLGPLTRVRVRRDLSEPRIEPETSGEWPQWLRTRLSTKTQSVTDRIRSVEDSRHRGQLSGGW